MGQEAAGASVGAGAVVGAGVAERLTSPHCALPASKRAASRGATCGASDASAWSTVSLDGMAATADCNPVAAVSMVATWLVARPLAASLNAWKADLTAAALVWMSLMVSCASIDLNVAIADPSDAMELQNATCGFAVGVALLLLQPATARSAARPMVMMRPRICALPRVPQT